MEIPAQKERKLIDTGVRVGLLLDNGNLVMDGFSLVETRVSGYWMSEGLILANQLETNIDALMNACKSKYA